MDTELIIDIEAGAIDPDVLDQLTRGLRNELLELGAEAVEYVRADEVPEGAKSAEAATLGALAVSVLPSFLPTLIGYLQSWSMRAENRRVRIKTQFGDRSVEVEYSPQALSSEDLDRLVQTLAGSLNGAEPPRGELDEERYTLVWEGAQALEALATHSPTWPLAEAALRLQKELYAPGRGGPVVAFIATRGELAATPGVIEAADRFVLEAQNLPGAYQQPAFECLSDFKKCQIRENSPVLCGLALAVCLRASLVKEPTAPGLKSAPANEAKTCILFLAADPTNAVRLRQGEELRTIRETLQLARLRDRFEVHDRTSVRPADLSQSLLDLDPQVVHFSGHGTSSGALCFEDSTGKAHPIPPEALAALFRQFSERLRCVVLNACYAESQAQAIARHIPYVIGTNQAMGDRAAIAFAEGFYQALGAGLPVEEAYELGCAQIRLQGFPADQTPVLHKARLVD